MIGIRMKRLFWLLLLLCIGSLLAMGLRMGAGREKTAAVRPIPSKAVYEIGLLQGDGVPEQDRMREGFLEALAGDGWEDGKNLHIEVLNGGGNKGALDEGAARFGRERKDLIAAVGTEAAEAAAGVFQSTPVVGMGVLNFQSAPWLKGHQNFTGVTSLPEVVQQFAAARRILHIRRMGVLYSEGDQEAENLLVQVRSAAVERMGMSLTEVAVPPNQPPEEAAAALAGQVDAVYITVDERMQRHFKAIVDALTRAGIPVVGSDDEMVRRGAVLSVSEDYYRMGFAAGKAASKLLSGQVVPQELPIRKQSDPNLVVNMAAVNTFHLGLPGDLWQKARKLYLYDGQPARP